jgi:hypothetical protein
MLLGSGFKITPIIKKTVPFLETMIPRLPGGSASGTSTPAIAGPNPNADGEGVGKKVLIGGALVVGGLLLFRRLKRKA